MRQLLHGQGRRGVKDEAMVGGRTIGPFVDYVAHLTQARQRNKALRRKRGFAYNFRQGAEGEIVRNGKLGRKRPGLPFERALALSAERDTACVRRCGIRHDAEARQQKALEKRHAGANVILSSEGKWETLAWPQTRQHVGDQGAVRDDVDDCARPEIELAPTADAICVTKAVVASICSHSGVDFGMFSCL
jgi:hypothetical protein